MTLLRHGFVKVIIISALVILAIIISLNIVLNRKLKSELPGYIDKLSKESRYSLKIRDVSLDPFFRLRLEGIQITDLSLTDARVAEIKEIKLDPYFFSSLLEQRLNVKEIVVQTPRVRLSKQNIHNLSELIKKGEKEEDKDKPSPVTVENLKLRDGYYQISPEHSLTSKELNLVIVENSKKNANEINLRGDLTVFGNELLFKGTVNSGQGLTAGVLEIELDDLSADTYGLPNNSPGAFRADARVNFEISELYKVNGTIKSGPKETDVSAPESKLNIEYDFSYDPSVKTAYLKKLDVKTGGLMEAQFSGTVDAAEGDLVFNINGRAESADLSAFSAWAPGLGQDKIAGSIRTRELKIRGSSKKGDTGLSGGIIIDGLAYQKSDGALSVSGLDCDLEINQNLSMGGSFPLTSEGQCTADKISSQMTGEIDDLSSKVKLDSANRWSEVNLSLSGLAGGFMGGRLSGSAGVSFTGGSFKAEGLLNARNLDLKKTPKSIIPTDIEGEAESVAAKFSGGPGEYKADISFTANGLVFRSGEGREFRLSKLSSRKNLDFTFVSDKEVEKSPDGQRDQIRIKNKGLSYQNLAFEEYLINNGEVESLDFSLTLGGDWDLNMSSTGREFQVMGKDISLERFSESLSIEKSGKEGFSGQVKGEGGKYQSIEFPSLAWEYGFKGNFIKLSGLKAVIGTIGEFRTNDLAVRMGERGGYPYRVSVEDGAFTGLDGKVTSEAVKGVFTINDPALNGLPWEGSLEAAKTEVLSQPIENILIDLTPTVKGLVLDNISGSFLGGDLTGKIDVDTTGPRTRMVTDIGLAGASLLSDDMGINIGKADLHFTGLLPQNSLPEGTGKIVLHTLNLNTKGVDYSYKGEISGKTEGETLFIEEGFISGKDRSELRFSGEMVNSLNEQRRLELRLPGISLPAAVNMLHLFLPQAVSEAKTQGEADLQLVFSSLFYPAQRWNGKLVLKRVSFTGMVAGSELNVKEVYGTITLRDKVAAENPLMSFVGDSLKLSKSVYQKFLRSLKEIKIAEDSDYLKIGELEYGILKFEDIEAELEVDREKLNLKRLTSKIFRGGLYGTGIFSFNNERSEYNLSFLFDKISLEAISKRISSAKDYITGRVNGLVWITGEGGDLNTVNGPFKFWAVKSSQERRKIGEALLDQLGAKEKLILGTSRSYDKGEISGYINDGVITFKVFNISNSILGIKNLSITADPRQNSISINHLISVIRELAKRSAYGGPKVESN